MQEAADLSDGTQEHRVWFIRVKAGVVAAVGAAVRVRVRGRRGNHRGRCVGRRRGEYIVGAKVQHWVGVPSLVPKEDSEVS